MITSIMPLLITTLLISLGIVIVIYSAWSMILFSTVKIILSIYYSLIKRTILLLVTQRKLKKAAAQNLRHNQAEGRGQNTVLATQLRAFSFQESLLLSKKDYKIISWMAFIAVALFIWATLFLSFIARYATVSHNDPLFFLLLIIALPFLFILVCSAITLPVILILHSLLHYGVKKTVKKLETFA
ncbi:hypothetical protein [Bartonella sp. MM55XZML]|uniref:hypothetical protein n=1 Tax=Bartonella sp. MM55XZML TaxID=3243552 RepID=UPI0035D0591B